MQRRKMYLLAATIGAFAPAAISFAQEAEPAPPPPPSRVFSLPENRTPQPQPDVQGPRAPGVSAPRLIRPEEEAQRPAARQPSTSQPAARPAPPTAQPTEQRPAPARPAQQTVERTPAPTGEAVAPDGGAEPAPDILNMPLPENSPPATDAPPAEPVATAPEQPETEGLPWWLFAGIGLLAAAIAAFFVRRRRTDTAGYEEVVEPELSEAVAVPAVEPSAPAVIPPAPEVKPEPVAPAPTPAPPTGAKEQVRVAIDFEPLVARFTPAGLSVRYRIHLENVCNEDVSDVAVSIGIRGADHGAMEGPAPSGIPCIEIDALPVNRRAVHEGEIQLAAAAIRPLRIDDKPMLVPIVDLMPRYRDREGHLHEHHAALLIGREHNPPTAKMAPFRLDGGFSQFGKLGCRMLRAGAPRKAAA